MTVKKKNEKSCFEVILNGFKADNANRFSEACVKWVKFHCEGNLVARLKHFGLEEHVRTISRLSDGHSITEFDQLHSQHDADEWRKCIVEACLAEMCDLPDNLLGTEYRRDKDAEDRTKAPPSGYGVIVDNIGDGFVVCSEDGCSVLDSNIYGSHKEGIEAAWKQVDRTNLAFNSVFGFDEKKAVEQEEIEDAITFSADDIAQSFEEVFDREPTRDELQQAVNVIKHSFDCSNTFSQIENLLRFRLADKLPSKREEPDGPYEYLVQYEAYVTAVSEEDAARTVNGWLTEGLQEPAVLDVVKVGFTDSYPEIDTDRKTNDDGCVFKHGVRVDTRDFEIEDESEAEDLL